MHRGGRCPNQLLIGVLIPQGRGWESGGEGFRGAGGGTELVAALRTPAVATTDTQASPIHVFRLPKDRLQNDQRQCITGSRMNKSKVRLSFIGATKAVPVDRAACGGGFEEVGIGFGSIY